MIKPKITRTYGPIHFEDLDPHRFEDLVRELIYDYKDWQSIEATGRSGSDAGFDIRAYDRAETITQEEDETADETKEVHPMEGNLWMIQAKREKELGPKKVKKIISEIDSKNPPYGYILVASTNFSKKSYDVFREVLRNKGVMEFYFWGKAELEDMLSLPKNDRILFTFFGISLVSRHRSRATEIRAVISTKNKLFRTLGEGHELHKSILIRDLNDVHYPYEGEYKDFKKRPRWKEYVAFRHHPIGLLCHNHKYFAYIDTNKKEWDITREVDLVCSEIEDTNDRELNTKKLRLIHNVWDFLPRANQGHLSIDCMVEYANIKAVDEKGDTLYKFPHIYVDFIGQKGPFPWCLYILKVSGKEIRLDEDYKRVEVFPKKFEKVKLGKIHKTKKIEIDSATLKTFKYRQIDALYDSDGKYNFLKVRDIIPVTKIGEKDEKTDEGFIQITYEFKTKIKDYLEQISDSFRIQQNIQQQLGKELDYNENINVYECKEIYKWELGKKK